MSSGNVLRQRRVVMSRFIVPVLLVLSAIGGGQSPVSSADPVVLPVNAKEPYPEEVVRLIQALRSEADGFVFLSGGASNMSDDDREALLDLFRCFEVLTVRGSRFAVGDGGTKAGIMEAAGQARAATGNSFPLLGVSPAPEVGVDGRSGSTPIDPNHSHVLAVTNDPWLEKQKKNGWEPSWGYWGSETETMYEIFGRLAEGRPSVTIVANGGGITLDEVEQNLRQNRKMIVIAGSGRAADAIVAALEGKKPDSEEVTRHLKRVASLAVRERTDRFRIFQLKEGPEALAEAVMEEIGTAVPVN
jgi:hypothetical protein